MPKALVSEKINIHFSSTSFENNLNLRSIYYETYLKKTVVKFNFAIQRNSFGHVGSFDLSL